MEPIGRVLQEPSNLNRPLERMPFQEPATPKKRAPLEDSSKERPTRQSPPSVDPLKKTLESQIPNRSFSWGLGFGVLGL